MLLCNKIKTPDGTIIESRTRHDFVSHKDSKTGRTYSVDGGKDYLRRMGKMADCKELSVDDDGTIELAREHLLWGSYGLQHTWDTEGPVLKYQLLKDMSDSHIVAILKDSDEGRLYLGGQLRRYFPKELDYRTVNKIVIEDPKDDHVSRKAKEDDTPIQGD